jgi:amino acid permease
MSTMPIKVKIKTHRLLISLPVLHLSTVGISVKKLKNSNSLRVPTNDFIQSYFITYLLFIIYICSQFFKKADFCKTKKLIKYNQNCMFFN